jgi:hypothetical protein
MLEAGIIRRSSSCWSSPLHMVRRLEALRRLSRLNAATVEDKYPLPNMGDLSSRLDGCVIFSKLDLQKGWPATVCWTLSLRKVGSNSPLLSGQLS